MISNKNLLILLRIPDRISTRMSKIRFIVGGILLIASFYFFIHTLHIGWSELEFSIQNANYCLLILTLLLYPLGFLPLVWAWHKIMCCIGGCCNFKTNVRLYSLSCLPKRIPGAIWYISTRVALYQGCHIDFSITIIATAIEMISLSFSGILLYLLLISTGAISLNLKLVSIAVIFIILIIAVLLWTPLVQWMSRWLQQRNSLGKSIEFKTWEVLQILGISIVAWLGGGILLYVLSNAFTTISAMQLLGLIGAWSVAGTIGLASGLFVQGFGI